MFVQVQSILCGKELRVPLPHEIDDAVFCRLKDLVIFKVEDTFVVGTEICYSDMSDFMPDKEGRFKLYPLVKPGGRWCYEFGIFPTLEQAKGLFKMLQCHLAEGISAFYPQHYNGETGEYTLPHELDFEMFQERLAREEARAS